MSQHGLGGPDRAFEIIRAPKLPARQRKGADRQAVPGRDDLMIAERRAACFPPPPEPLSGFAQALNQCVVVETLPPGIIFQRLSQIGDIPALEITGPGDLIQRHEFRRRSLQHGLDFLFVPDKKPALFAFAVGVGRGIKRAARVAHLAHEIIQRFRGHPLEVPGAGQLPGPDQHGGEVGLVVQHLFKVRHEPAPVGGIAVKTAADVIIDAAADHRAEAVADGVQGLAMPGINRVFEQETEIGLIGKLGRLAEAAAGGVVMAEDIARGQIDGPGADLV